MRERNNGSMYQKTSCDTSREREERELKLNGGNNYKKLTHKDSHLLLAEERLEKIAE